MTYTPSFVGRVQPFNRGYGTGNTDITITAVDPNYTIILASFASLDTSGFPCGAGLGYITLLNSTTVRIVTGTTSSGSCVFTVVELTPTLLRQPVQYRTVTLSGVTSANGAALTAVGPRAFVVPLGFNENKGSTQTNMASVTCVMQLSSATLVTVARGDAGGASAPDIMVASCCVVDPK